MRKLLLALSVTLATIVAVIGIMFVFDLCPPDGPWPMPPWCDQAEGPVASDAPVGAGDPVSTDGAVALGITGILDNLDGIQGHFSEAVVGMGQSGVSDRSSQASGEPAEAQIVEAMFTPETRSALLDLALAFQPRGPVNIPSGFRGPIGPTGGIGAPAGACGAGASATASFRTAGTPADPPQTVTSDLLDDLQIENIDFDVLTGSEGRESLEATITSLITPGDPRLATPEGWNEAVWEPLAELQEPAESLMDYHLWTVATDIEQLVIGDVRQTMVDRGIPAVVIDAFDASNNTGWFANMPSDPGDRLAAMDIEAVFSGDLEGTITEERDFSIPVPGEMPVFSPLIGDGAVTFLHPDLGPIDFVVDLEWTGWDELGRVNVGTAHFVNDELGYEIIVRFAEDGTKTGDVLKDGVVVGQVDLTAEGGGTYLEMSSD